MCLCIRILRGYGARVGLAVLIAWSAERATAQQNVDTATWSGRTALAIPLTGIRIDGRLDEWPKMPVYPIRHNSGAYGETDLQGVDLDTSADFSPAFRVGYDLDEQLIYLAVEVHDDHVRVDKGDVKGTDAVELYLSPRVDVGPPPHDPRFRCGGRRP